MDMESGINTLCFVCNETIMYDGVIVTRGMETLIETSKERKDNHHVMLQGKSSLQMHRSCQKRYTAKSRGKFTNPNLTSPPTKPLAHLLSPKRKKVRECSRFDFASNCLFCGLPANQVKIKKGVKKRVPMRIVMDSDFKKLLDAKIQTNFQDEECRVLSERISNVNLESVQAKYHLACRIRFLDSNQDDGKTVGRPPHDITTKQLAKVKSHIETTDESMYNIKDLIKITGNIQRFLIHLILCFGEFLVIE